MALRLTSDTTGKSIGTVNLSKIQKGQRINLSKEHPTLKRILMKVNWQAKEDVDISVVLLNDQEKAVRQDKTALCFYDNLQCQGISHSPDILGDEDDDPNSVKTEEIVIELGNVEASAKVLSFVASTHEEQPPATTFGCVRNTKVYLIDMDTNQALYTFDMEEDHSTATCVEIARLYNKGGEWRFTSLESEISTFHMGLQGALDKFFN